MPSTQRRFFNGQLTPCCHLFHLQEPAGRPESVSNRAQFRGSPAGRCPLCSGAGHVRQYEPLVSTGQSWCRCPVSASLASVKDCGLVTSVNDKYKHLLIELVTESKRSVIYRERDPGTKEWR